MTANKITDVLGVATPLSTKEKAFWYAVWVLDAVSYMVVATLVYLVHQRFAGGAIGAGLALAIGALAFGLTRYGLWRLTRPYATTADAVVPAVDRAELCISISSSFSLRWHWSHQLSSCFCWTIQLFTRPWQQCSSWDGWPSYSR